jgi:hypothetical protein
MSKIKYEDIKKLPPYSSGILGLLEWVIDAVENNAKYVIHKEELPDRISIEIKDSNGERVFKMIRSIGDRPKGEVADAVAQSCLIYIISLSNARFGEALERAREQTAESLKKAQ